MSGSAVPVLIFSFRYHYLCVINLNLQTQVVLSFLCLDSAFSSARERHTDKTRNSLQEESLCPCNWVSAAYSKLFRSWIFNGSWSFINVSVVKFNWCMHTNCYYCHYEGFAPPSYWYYWVEILKNWWADNVSLVKFSMEINWHFDIMLFTRNSLVIYELKVCLVESKCSWVHCLMDETLIYSIVWIFTN